MEELVKQMQSSEPTGVPVKSQKSFLMSIPAAFIGKFSKIPFSRSSNVVFHIITTITINHTTYNEQCIV